VPRPAALVPAAALRSLARRPPPPQAKDGTKADRCALAVERPCPPLVNGKAAPPLPLNEWKQCVCRARGRAGRSPPSCRARAARDETRQNGD
jgi:hypothetical protein